MGSPPRSLRRSRWSSVIVPVLTTAAMFLASPPAAPSDNTMRCGSRLVGEGDGKDKVRTLCGEPTSISLAGYVGGPGYVPNYYNRPIDYSYGWAGWTALPVEIWTYNLGPNRLLRTVRFVGDELYEIRTHGYGY